MTNNHFLCVLRILKIRIIRFIITEIFDAKLTEVAGDLCS